MKRTSLTLIFTSFIFIVPFIVSAETSPLSNCEAAQGKMKQTQNTRVPLELQREQTKNRVRTIYQDLLICRSTGLLTEKQRLNCQQLEQEAPKQFQTMLKLVTASHQASLELKTLTKQVKRLCATPSTTASLTHISQLALQ